MESVRRLHDIAYTLHVESVEVTRVRWLCVCTPRCLSEDNQTASIDSLRQQHEGVYRCVAHGHDGDVISNDVTLDAQGQIIPPRTGVVKLTLR